MRILFAVDIHEPDLSRRLTEAVGWASKLNGTLDLLFVTQSFTENRYAGPQVANLQRGLQEILDQMRIDLQKLLLQIPETHRGNCEVTTAPKVGEAIAERAKGYELLLLHTHGRTGLSHLFLGSVAERVVRIAPVPTMVLRVPE